MSEPTREPPPPPREPPQPLEVPMVPFAVGGTALFAIAGLVMLPFRDRLDADGRDSWIGICVAGVLLGLVGLSVMIVHDRNRRRLAPLDPGGTGRE